MAIFFIACIGIILTLLYIKHLTNVDAQFLNDVLRVTGLTLISMSILLFLVSGRVAHATVLLAISVWLYLLYRKKKISGLLESPLTDEKALNLLQLKKLPASLQDLNDQIAHIHSLTPCQKRAYDYLQRRISSASSKI